MPTLMILGSMFGYLVGGFVTSALMHRWGEADNMGDYIMVVWFWPIAMPLVLTSLPLERLWHWIAGK